ncbi:MAG: hydroxymethylbilane synthase [Armatimonadota bacterium]|jgi:hydroxymethylbilane synthase
MPQDPIRVGTRGSKLALIQARAVIGALRTHSPGIGFEEHILTTTGDRVTGAPLSQIGAVGLFTKEIEAALLGREIHVAVHSAKDVPTTLPDGLCLVIILEREDARDVLVLREAAAVAHGAPLDALCEGATVGTSSERRKAQLLHQRPDLHVVPLRGNLDTRLRKLDAERLDAIVVAAAGLARMGISSQQAVPMPIDMCVPAAGQGALAVELRRDDGRLTELVSSLRHEPTVACVAAERAALATLGGGCPVPIGLHARIVNGRLRLQAVVAETTGEQLVRAGGSGPPEDAERIGSQVAQELLGRGARDMIRAAENGGGAGA